MFLSYKTHKTIDYINKDARSKALLEIDNEEKKLDDVMKNFIDKQTEIKSKLKVLNLAADGLNNIQDKSKLLVTTLNQTSLLAEHVSAKVRQLDLARSRVAECQQRVHDLIDMQVCSEGVEEAIRNQNYELGAAHVQRFLCMSAGSVRSAPENLTKAVQVLQGHISTRFKEAVAKKDEANIEKLFKVFPMVDMGDEGITQYAQYLGSLLCDKTISEIATLRTASEVPSTAPLFADAFTRLLENSAQVVEKLRLSINHSCGVGHLLIGLKTLQGSVDKCVKLLSGELLRARNLQSPPSDPRKNVNKSLPDALSLDPLLSELTAIHLRSILYFAFLKRRIENDEEPGKLEESLKDFNTFFNKSELHMFAQEVLGHYLALERYHLDESITKAIKLAAPVEGQTNSSMIDDAFYIVKKCINRSIGSGSVEGVCSMLLEGTRALEKTVYHLTRALSAQPPLHPIKHPDRNLYLAQVGDAWIGSEYLQRLIGHVRCSLNAVEARATPALIKNLHSCLNSLVGVSNTFRLVQEMGIKQLRSALKPIIHERVDEFNLYSYVPSEDEWATYGGEDEFVGSLINELDTLLTPLVECLPSAAFESLKNAILTDLASRLEKHIFNSTFNRLGGLRLERGIRRIVSWSGSRVPCARLIAAGSILAAHSIDDVIATASSQASTFTLQQVKALAATRIDFHPEDIKKIKL